MKKKKKPLVPNSSKTEHIEQTQKRKPKKIKERVQCKVKQRKKASVVPWFSYSWAWFPEQWFLDFRSPSWKYRVLCFESWKFCSKMCLKTERNRAKPEKQRERECVCVLCESWEFLETKKMILFSESGGGQGGNGFSCREL